MQVLYDAQYKTPFFFTLSGTSSCIHEPNTNKREDPYVEIPDSPLTNYPPDSVVEIKVVLRNRSPTYEGQDFKLVLLAGSNPDGLQLKINGVPLTSFLLSDLAAQTADGAPSLILTMTAQRSRGSTTYVYNNLKLALVSECELAMAGSVNGDGIARLPLGTENAASFDVRFQQFCSPVEFWGKLKDEGGFQITRANGEGEGDTRKYLMEVRARNPDHSTLPWHEHPYLQDVRVEYRIAGRGAWTRAKDSAGNFAYLFRQATYDSNQQDSAYYSVTLDFSSPIQDGEYELRIVSHCSADEDLRGEQITPIMSGTIDREPPNLFGEFGEPSDGLYSPGDSIALAFTENVDCRKPFLFNVFMVVCAPDAQSCKNDPADPGFVKSIPMNQLDVVCEGWVCPHT